MPSSTSSYVRKAIQTALELEAFDRGTPKQQFEQDLESESSFRSEGSKTPTQASARTISAAAEVHVGAKPTQSVKPVQPTQLAQPVQRVQQQFSPPQTRSPTGRPLSKLALLAQSKADASKGPRLPKTTTEYLTPISNGSTVTTAITTSYQSLYSLTDPSRPAIIPKLDVVPLPSSNPTLNEAKPSKLAMKIKRANQKHAEASNTEEEVITPPVSPMFQSPRARASPSAFALLLVDDPLTSSETQGSGNNEVGQKEEGFDSHIGRTQKRKQSKPPVPTASSSSSFAFDVPSPDDVVFNARRGTNLAHNKITSSPRMPGHPSSSVRL